MFRPQVAVVAIALCGSLAACGTTVPSAQLGADPSGLGGAAGVQGEGLAPGEPGTYPGDANAAEGGVGGAAAAPGTGQVTAGEASAPGTTPGASGPVGSGTSGTPAARGARIKVGITYPDTAALAAIFGRDATNPRTWFEKILAYINKHGGVSGRTLDPVYYVADVAQDASQLGQEACATFTEDNKVDIVINAGVLGDTLPACLAKAGLSTFDVNAFATDAADMQRIRNRFLPFAMRVDRHVPAILNASAQRGLVKRGDTLGVLVEDCAWGPRVHQNTVQPLAQRLGLKVVKGTHRCVTNLVSDLGPVTNDIQRETLRFRTEGVTHVMSVSGVEAFVIAQFTQNARQQEYHPKYLVSSNAYPYGNSQSDAVIQISPDALPNMTGVGTLPLLDIGALARPDGPAQQAAQATCKAADPGEGAYASTSDNGRYFARNTYLGLCDTVFAVKAVLEANGVRFGLGDLIAGYDAALSGKTGSAVLAGGVFRANRERRDGAGLVRPFAYDSKKSTFVYTGTAVPVP